MSGFFQNACYSHKADNTGDLAHYSSEERWKVFLIMQHERDWKYL